jgi:hypothetical protein
MFQRARKQTRGTKTSKPKTKPPSEATNSLEKRKKQEEKASKKHS